MVVLNNLGRGKEIIEVIDKNLKESKLLKEFRPRSLDMYAFLLYKYTKRYKEGTEIARRVVKAEPHVAAYWDTLACNLHALGSHKEALKAFEKALSLKKADQEITWNALAKLYEVIGKQKEAKQAYKKAKILEKEAKHVKDVKSAQRNMT